jgi:hypothetical protein
MLSVFYHVAVSSLEITADQGINTRAQDHKTKFGDQTQSQASDWLKWRPDRSMVITTEKYFFY